MFDTIESKQRPFSALSDLLAERVKPVTDWSDVGGGQHFVQFYENDGFIIEALAGYVLNGLEWGQTSVVVATTEHLALLDMTLRAHSRRFEAACSDGSYVALDAEETLSRLMTDGMPDAAKFDAVIGDLIRPLAKRGRVRIFGEMVGVLCTQGNFVAAVALEELWNGLHRECQFSLYCAYPLDSVSTAGVTEHFAGLCHAHASVIPCESFTQLPNGQRMAEVARLQQHSLQLENELAELRQRVSQN